MMNTPLISVVLPVYNSASYLMETLKSVSAQTFQNWELIAIDDGSTDDSYKILQSYAQTENRMRLVSRENRGLVSTLNEGIRMARGEWIARMDADDICLPDRFARQLAWIEENDADVCGGGIERIGNTGGHSWVFPSSCTGIYAWLLFRSAFAHPTVMLRKKIAMQFPYSEEFAYAQDYELWTRMALNQVKMTNYPATVLSYRIHIEQVSHAKKEAQTNLRVEITRHYWECSELCRNLHLQPCLVDERVPVSRKEFLDVIQSLGVIERRLTDAQARNAINHHRVWFIYRSIHLGLKTVLPALRGTKLSTGKKFAVAILAALHAGRVIDYFRNADWIRYLPLKWFF